MRTAVLAVLSLGLAVLPQTRDAAPASAAASTGTAVIVGRVIAADVQAAIVRHATVTLGGGNLRSSREVMTDDQGRFTFTGLAAGAYTLSVAKVAWVTSYYGGRRPGMKPFAAAPLVLGEGERTTGIELRLLHGSAITGVVRDATGAPASAQVEVAQFRMSGGVKHLVWVPGSNSSDETDDRGVYRLFGLPPGEYLLSARRFEFGEGALHLMTSDILQAALQDLSKAAASPAEQGRAVTYSDVYYPGTADMSAATLLKIGANEEKTGVDFPMQLVPTARISGSVAALDGRPPLNAMIQLESPTLRPEGDNVGDVGYAASFSTGIERDGTFSMAAVPPGQYRIVVRADDPNGTPGGRGRIGGPGASPALWAAQEITVDGHDQAGLALTLQPGMTVTGRVSAAASIDVTKCTVVLKPVMAGGMASRAPLDADGVFAEAGVAPGWYRLDVVTSQPGGGVKVASARIGQSDVADLPFEVRPSTNIANLAVKLTPALGEIAGTLRDASDRPAAHYVIAVFSADRAYWTSRNRRMPAPTETLADGRFRIADLPAGDYFILMATDLDPDSLQDPAVLAQLASQAQRVTLGEGEKKVQDFRLSGGLPPALP